MAQRHGSVVTEGRLGLIDCMRNMIYPLCAKSPYEFTCKQVFTGLFLTTRGGRTVDAKTQESRAQEKQPRYDTHYITMCFHRGLKINDH